METRFEMRVSEALLAEMDAVRGASSRAAFIRAAIEEALEHGVGPARKMREQGALVDAKRTVRAVAATTPSEDYRSAAMERQRKLNEGKA